MTWLNPTTLRFAMLVVMALSLALTGTPAFAEEDWGG